MGSRRTRGADPGILERTIFENAWEVEPGLYRILLPLPWSVPFVNAYLIESRGEWMLVDCGLNWGPSLRALGRALKAIGVPRGGLTYLLLTHRHPDHSGGAGPVQERWGGAVLLHPIEAARRYPGPPLVRSWLEEHGLEEPALLEQLSSPPRRPEEVLPPEVSPLADSVRLGDLRFEVLPAPGHAWGQVMLREPARGWLLAADQVLPAPAVNVWSHPGDEGDPLGAYLTSLAAAEGLSCSLLLPGHGIPLRGGLREGARAMADFHRAFAAEALAHLRGRRLTTWEVTRLLYPRWAEEPGEIRFLMAEALAALRYLATTRAVRREADGRWEPID
ncbi:MAG: MBL fold metallo-hydrolase [Bacillota bacterium]